MPNKPSKSPEIFERNGAVLDTSLHRGADRLALANSFEQTKLLQRDAAIVDREIEAVHGEEDAFGPQPGKLASCRPRASVLPNESPNRLLADSLNPVVRKTRQVDRLGKYSRAINASRSRQQLCISFNMAANTSRIVPGSI